MRHAVGLGLIIAMTAPCGPALAQAPAAPPDGGIAGDLLHSLPPDPQQGGVAPKATSPAADPQVDWRGYLAGHWSATFDSMNTGGRIIAQNEMTYQGDKFGLASHFLIKTRAVDLVVVGRYTVAPAPGDRSKATLSYSIVDWSPKEFCTDRCMAVPKPTDQTDTLERVDADTVKDGQGHVWHRG